MLSTRAKVLESLRYCGIKSMQVPHVYSVSQKLQSYMYLWRSRHPKTTRTYEYITEVDHFYTLNLCQSAGITEVLRNQVHTGTLRIFCLTTTSLTCIYPCIIWGRIGPKKLYDTWNVTLKYEISWAWCRVNTWLTVMNQARRSWLTRVLTSYTSLPRMSRNGYDKDTCDLGERKRHVKRRNLKNLDPYECVVGGNAPDTT
jgi:hypothetical protein